ncbi:MAG: hypothetical protein J6R34_03320 [Clostridia bacterium]|nr:hypothetical protein [Clostridia bacterium]MBO5983011.1 hypothetical protein [Clostridia bacterium]MBO7326159.1 hypothetical protein [Clostridia bacterium]
MGIFDDFIFKDGKIVDNSWVKWFHWNVPDKEGLERDALRNNLLVLGHCKECTVLSGCYFVKSRLPQKKAEGFGLLHPHCDCKANRIQKPHRKITAICPIEKFTEYIFSYKYADNGKLELFKKHLGFTKKNSKYLKKEFETQAMKKYLNGDYEIGKLDEFGQRINIEINVSSAKKPSIKLITGWMVHPLGKIVCTAPLGA